MSSFSVIHNKIKEQIDKGNKNFIICPFGDNGLMTKQILNNQFGVEEAWIIDTKLCEYNNKIKNINYFKEINTTDYIVLLNSYDYKLTKLLKKELLKFFAKENMVVIFENDHKINENITNHHKRLNTSCGKYSYGSLCNHIYVEKVGAFCSFAKGVDVAINHPLTYLSTHPFMYCDEACSNVFEKYDNCKEEDCYFPGVKPKGKVPGLHRITIGNDVWLGQNVLITNSANIGNGVIAGAGAVITKDVPDYAVVVGVPARIIRYRYTPEQIKKLNKIAWWDWPDEKIRECYDDFFIDIEEFITKHYKV